MKLRFFIIIIIALVGFLFVAHHHGKQSIQGAPNLQNRTFSLAKTDKEQNKLDLNQEDIFKKFHVWMNQALENDGTIHPALVKEGVKLAKLRKPHMADLIKNDPKQALEKAVSWKQFLSMPVAVRRQLEEPFSENAEWQVLPICNPASTGPHGNVVSMVLSDATTATTYAVTPYGRRIGLQTKRDIPLQGIRMDGVAAVDEKIFQVLSTSDLDAVKAVFPVANNNPNLSAVDNVLLPQNPVAALAGKKIYLFASTEELQRAENTIQKAEHHPGPRMRPTFMPMADLPPGSSAPTLNLPAITQAAIQASQIWTLTPKTFLCIVVDFPDKPGAPVDINYLTNTVSTLVNTNIINFSYGKTSLQVTAAPQALYRMPQPSTYYTTNYNNNQLHLDAENLCKNSGLDPSLFDIRMVCFANIGMQLTNSGIFNFPYGGLAGGSHQWIQARTNWNIENYVDTISHETGHNYGVSHAHSWDTTDGSVMSTNGTNTEYGDIFDTMAVPVFHPADYNPILKTTLGWMTLNQTLNLTNGITTNRIYAFDFLSAQSNAPLALRVQNGSSQAFVVGIRRSVTNNTYLNNGLYVLWDYDPNEYTSRLLDMTPNSPAGKNDAALSLYKTFTDPTGLVKITPIAQGGSGSNAWMDVAVALGPLTPHPPAIVMSNSIYGKSRSATAFSCTATNSTHAPLYYTWDFGDGSVGSAGNTISHVFQIGGTYKVTVTATDAQGGIASKSCTAMITDQLQSWSSVTNTSGIMPSLGIYANGAWILGGNSWNNYLFSSDGATWKSLTVPNNSQDGFAYGGGTFVSFGYNGISYSTNAQIWLTSSLTNTGTVQSVAFGNGVFVAGLSGGSILVSSNGSKWSSYTSPVIGTNYLSQIVFGNGVFLSRVNDWGTGLCRSSDGVNWNMLSASTGLPTDMQFNQLAYEPNNGIFAVIGWNGSAGWSAVYTSTNGGSNWSSSSVPAGYSVYNLQAGGGIFAALATSTNSTNPSLLISSDGMNWGAYPISDGATNGLLIGNGQILRLSRSTNVPMQMAAISTATPPILTMSNSIYGKARSTTTFTCSATTSNNTALYYTWDFGDGSFAFGNNTVSHIFQVGGTYKVTVTVTDAQGGIASKSCTAMITDQLQSWSSVTNTSGIMPSLGIYANGAWILGGNSWNNYLFSSDGATWKTLTSPNGWPNGFAYGGGTFVSFGYNGISYSTNAQNWLTSSLTNTGTVQSVAFGNGVFVAGLSGGSILVSSNGSKWSSYTVTEGNSLSQIVFGNGVFLSRINYWGTGLCRSSDGVNWNMLSASTGLPTDMQFNQLAYEPNNGIFAVIGLNGSPGWSAVYTSTNGGSNWSSSSVPAGYSVYNLQAGGGIFAALATSTNSTNPSLLISSDGMNWGAYPISDGATNGLLIGNGQILRLSGSTNVPMQMAAISTATPPILTMSNSIYGKARSTTTFTCSATTSNNTPLYYTWDFGDGSFAFGNNTVSHIFQVGGTYKVTVTVTDAQGGIASKSCTAMIADQLQSWSSVTNTSGIMPSLGIYANGAWILGGNSWNNYLFSSDGATWKTLTSPNGWPNGFAYGGGTFVSFGYNGISYSTNAQNWLTSSLTNTGTVQSVAFGNGVFVAGLSGGSILVSSNGSNWSSYTSPVIGTNYLSQIVFGNGVFLSRINYWGTGLCRSSDGVNWNMLSASTGLPTNTQFNQLAYEPNNGIFAVIGWNGSPGWSAVYTSTNGGSNWSSSSVPAGYSVYNLQAGGGIFAALATSTNSTNPSLLISSDGMNWGAYPISDGATNGLLIGNGQILRLSGSTNVPMQMAAITPMPCNISIATGGPCRVSSNNTPLTNELPHVGETYPLYIQLNVSGTAQPFDLVFQMGAQTTTYTITNSLKTGAGYWWWFYFNSNLDGPIPWKITVDPNNTSGNTNISNTISGTFTPIPPTNPVITYNTNYATAFESNVLSFKSGSGTISNLKIVMGVPPTLPTQNIYKNSFPSNSQILQTTPQGINLCVISYTNVSAQIFTNVASFTTSLSSIAVNSDLLNLITWNQVSLITDPSLLALTKPSSLAESTDTNVLGFVNSVLPANYQKTLSPYAAARLLHKAVAGYITYTTPSPSSSAVDVLKNKHGDCGSYAMLLTASLRSLGIPAKPIQGFWMGSESWHVRTEFYLPSIGWILADACQCNSIDPRGTYAYYFGNVDNANQYFAMDSGDSKLIPFKESMLNADFVQVVNFFWDGGAAYLTNHTTSCLITNAQQRIGSFSIITNTNYFPGKTLTISPPTASSGLPVTLTVKSGPATIAGNVLSITGAGTITLAADQTGDDIYFPADEVTTNLVIGLGNQTISFPAVPAQSVTNPPFQLNATASSGLPVSYTTSSTNITVSSNVVSILGGGTATIVASQIGDSNWDAATSITNTFVISKVTNTIGAFTPIPTQTYSNGATVIIAPPVASSGLPVTLTVISGPATISSNTITLTGAGVVVLAANQAGNANFSAASELTTSFSVSKASQTINAFSTIAGQMYSNGATVTITPPTASSSLPVTVTVKSGPATISGNTVTLTGAGTVVLAANQAGNGNYLAATEVTTSFTVAQSPQTVGDFGVIPGHAYGDAPFSVTAPTASSGLPVVLSVVSGPATISGNMVTITGVGTVVLAADQSGNGNYLAATQVTRSFIVGQGSQTISFGALTNRIYGGAPFTLSSTASSGLVVGYSSSSTNVSLSSNVVTILGAGTATITASQPGNSNWSGATPVSQNLVIAPASQTINAFTTIPNQTYSNGATVTITPPTASSSLPVTVTMKSGPATISGNTVTLTGAGTLVLAANQSGNGNYNAASEVTTSFSVGAGSQTISFQKVPSQSMTTNPLILSSSASSGLPVTYTILSGAATIQPSNAITLLGVGTITVQASQPGNGNWSAAAPVNQTFLITKGSQAIDFAAFQTNSFGQPAYVLTNASASSGLPVTYASSAPKVATIVSNTLTIVGAGTATITASQQGNANWGAATSVSQTLVVAKASNRITAFTSVPNPTYASNGIVSLPSPLPVASSGLPVTISVKSGPAVMSGTKEIKITGGGVVVLAANQAGNGNVAPAPEVTTSFQIQKATQSIAPFATIAPKTNGMASFGVKAPLATSGLPVTISVKSGPASVTGTNLTLMGSGTVVLSANQNGNSNFLAAPEIQTAFLVAKGSQTITFAALAKTTNGSPSIRLTATASSRLPVAYITTSTNVVISNNMVTVLGVGTATIIASQAGDDGWNKAADVSQNLVVLGPLASNSIATNQTAGVALASNFPTIPKLPVTFPLARPLSAGTVMAWGDNSYGEINVPKGLTNIVQISSSGLHSLALRTNGTVVAWGWNAYGQTNVPKSATNVVQVSAGASFSMALKSDGRVVVWGNNSIGQTNLPAGLTNVVQIAAGQHHAVALRSDGRVTAWGWDDYGQCDVPVDATNVVQVTAGYFHSATLKADGTVIAWGDNMYGETDVPAGLSNVVRIATGLNHTLALCNDGTVAAWGWDNAGQIDVPAGLSGVCQIAAGGNTSFAVTTNGTLITWGDNSYGQRKPPASLSGIYQFVLGLCHALGLKK